MSGGFEMGNVWYEEPNSLDTAFDVMGDIILSTAAQQYGGFTVPEVDKTLDPYANKSYKKYIDEFYVISDSLKVFNKDLNKLAKEYALNKIKRDFEQGWQGIEYKLNTVGSSRGDYPFVTMTFGLATTEFGKMAAITFLNVHKEGQGKKGNKKPVLFPKLVFLYDENIHGEGRINEDVFDAGIECSLKTMYPDWLSLTGEGYVPSMYKKYSKVVSPMGCVDGNEIVTYKYKDRLFVESFKRMWNRLSDNFIVKEQFLGNHNNLYISADNLKIYDTEKGFVSVKKVIRNTSDKWFNVKMSHGRSLLCTEDHPFHTGRGRIEAKDLAKGDSIKINPNQYFEENIYFDSDKAWLLGFILCDGCYDGHITSSIAYESEDDIEIKYKERMKKCFGLDTKTVLQERDKKGNYKDLNSYGDNCSNVIDYLSVKFEGLTKNRRHIPNEVFEWDYRAKLNFLAGMIDADGYINPKSHGGSVVQIGSTNKELALQQMALAQSLDMPSAIYQNHYTSKNPNAIRYRVEFAPSDELLSVLVSHKKVKNYVENITNYRNFHSEINEVIPVQGVIDYSYDVETESDHFEVSGIYSHNCRAFLSPWYENGGIKPKDENDVPVFVGRFNLGAISLNLPMILAKSKHENKDFYDVLDYYLEMIRGLHKRTFEYLGEMRASTNPLAYCEGGFYGGKLKPTDKIKSILKPMTLSFGFTALNELQELHNKKSLVEDGEFALNTMTHINEKINQYKEEDDLLYAIYATPAESLCGLQVDQFRKQYGIIDGVSDRTYVSNSFHCAVWEDISPIQKQNLENRFWNLSNGGKIQYCKYPINYNKEAVISLVKRAMKMGLYEGVNLSLAYCDDCGHQELEMDVCPECGSSNLTKIDRMNGYLAFSRVHGDTRLNKAKMDEIAERKSM
jgi:anaerobic ribonucleoside-triphosphate reductase